MLVKVQQSRARHELFKYNISMLTTRVHVAICRKNEPKLIQCLTLK